MLQPGRREMTLKSALPLLTLLSSLLAGCDLQEQASSVKVKEEPALGLTEHSFDQGYLQDLAEATRKAAEESLQEAYERNRVPPEARLSHAQTRGHYEWLGQRQLAVIDLSYTANPMRVTRIVGIENDRLITVSCISPRGEPLNPFDEGEECGRSVKRYFPATGK
jgi:hypothetical protein